MIVGDLPGSPALVDIAAGFPSKGSIRQCYRCVIYKALGGHQQLSWSRSESHLVLGGGSCPQFTFQEWKLTDRLPQLLAVVTSGVGSPPGSLQGMLLAVGYAQCVFFGVQVQWKTGQVHFQDQGSSDICRGCSVDTLGPILLDLCLPSVTASSASTLQDLGRGNTSDSDYTSLAQESMVLR